MFDMLPQLGTGRLYRLEGSQVSLLLLGSSGFNVTQESRQCLLLLCSGGSEHSLQLGKGKHGGFALLCYSGLQSSGGTFELL